MSESTQLSTFPSSREEALAMLYVQQQDLRSATPEKITELYHDALKRAKVKWKELRATERAGQR